MHIKYGKLALFAALVFFMAGCRLTTTDIKATLYNKVAPGMLEIPVDATSVSFLQGRWYAIVQSKDRAYDQKIEEYYDFDSSGAGTVQIKEKMTRQICTGKAQANMRGGALELHRYNVRCPSGLHYVDQTFICDKEGVIGTICRPSGTGNERTESFTFMKR